MTLNGASRRWVIGEFVEPINNQTGLRDMYNPHCSGQPAQVNDDLFSCRLVDQGSVHVNSGPISQTYTLLVDGAPVGEFTNDGVPALGIVKAINVYARAFYTKTTPVTTFAQHATDLVSACTELVGQPLRNPLDGNPVPGITLAPEDCDLVAAVTNLTGIANRLPCDALSFSPAWTIGGTIFGSPHFHPAEAGTSACVAVSGFKEDRHNVSCIYFVPNSGELIGEVPAFELDFYGDVLSKQVEAFQILRNMTQDPTQSEAAQTQIDQTLATTLLAQGYSNLFVCPVRQS